MTDLFGGIIALGFTVACLAFRAWLTAPERPSPGVVRSPQPMAPVDIPEKDEEEEDGSSHPPERSVASKGAVSLGIALTLASPGHHSEAIRRERSLL